MFIIYHRQGTSTTDGIALLVASLNSFLSRGEDCPLLVASTHFHEIAKYSLISHESPIRFLVGLFRPQSLFRVTQWY
jgi:hypothetical protein